MDFSPYKNFQEFILEVDSINEFNKKESAVNLYLHEIKGRSLPLIEDDAAIFIYIAEPSIKQVQIAGDFNEWKPQNLSKIDGTNFYYISKKFDGSARSDYKFILNKQNWIVDPGNPRINNSAFGNNSELAMPLFKQPEEVIYKNKIPHGSIIQRSLKSNTTGNTYQLKIYLPPNFDSNKNYPTIYIHDGNDYINLGNAINIFDNILFNGNTDPFIGVFIEPVDRNKEYGGSLRYQYITFIVNDLVPYIDSTFRTIKGPQNRLTIGTSLGGNISILLGYYHPDVFGLIGLHSAACYVNNYEASDLLFSCQVKELKIFSVWGAWEHPIVENWRTGINSLVENNFAVKWTEYWDGHSWGLWRHTMRDMINYFFPRKTLFIHNNEPERNLNLDQKKTRHLH